MFLSSALGQIKCLLENQETNLRLTSEYITNELGFKYKIWKYKIIRRNPGRFGGGNLTMQKNSEAI